MLLLIAAFTLLLKLTRAVFADEAWAVDYHYGLLGEPRESTTFFHRPNPESKASLIYTLSEKNVLGALNPKDGSIVWRQWLGEETIGESQANTTNLRAVDGSDIAISSAGRQVAAWNAGDGKLAWLHDAAADVLDLEIFEFGDSKPAKDAVVLVGGTHPSVQRLDGASGALIWEYKLDHVDLSHQVSVSAKGIYAILLHKTILGYIKIRVVSIDPATGSKTEEYTLNSESELASADTVLTVGANSASPIIAWTDAAHTTLKVNLIGSKTISTFSIDQPSSKPVIDVKVHAPYHANSLAHFLVHYRTATEDWAEVFHINLKAGKIEKAYQLPKFTGRSAFSTSTIDANVYFTRITREEVLTVSSVSHGVLGRWDVKGLASTSLSDDVEPEHAVTEVSIKGDTVSAIRCAVWLASGELVLLRNGVSVWQRPEALADTVAVAFTNPPEAESLARELEVEAHSNPVQAYLHRITRHIVDLKALPDALRALPQRFVNGFLGADTDARDSFGFHKTIVCATSKGRLLALDVGAAGKLLWSKRVVDHAWRPSLTALLDGSVLVTDGISRETISVSAKSGATVPPSTSDTETGSVAGSIEFQKHDNKLEAFVAGQAKNTPLWTFVPKDGERILNLVPRPVNDPVASIGIVLGDRRVLYKYLNSNLALVTSAHDTSRTASFHVIDTVSGAVLYSNVHPDVDLGAPVASTLSENWFAYSFTADSSDVSPKGQQLVVGELFESLSANDRGPLEASTNISSFASNIVPFVLTQTYHIQEPISRLAVTSTRQSITSRQLLAVLPESNSIVGIPRSVIDPRRPVNRDPTKDEQMEGLTRYSPGLDFDPRWNLNHQREVFGIREVVTTPALLESTSLVFAYGLDVFGTRLSPSFNFDMLGKDFNKFQMLATVGALAIITFVVAPLVTRKQVNARWQFA